MDNISPKASKNFEKQLQTNHVPEKYWPYYKKWLRYYLHFCNKYHFPCSERSSLVPFLEKLNEKKQPEIWLKQAHHAVVVFLSMNRKADFSAENSGGPAAGAPRQPPEAEANRPKSIPNPEPAKRRQNPAPSRSAPQPFHTKPSYPPAPSIEEQRQPAPAQHRVSPWDQAHAALATEIRVRHYSPKTLKTYADWVVKFQSFVNGKAPEQLEDDDYKNFLTKNRLPRPPKTRRSTLFCSFSGTY